VFTRLGGRIWSRLKAGLRTGAFKLCLFQFAELPVIAAIRWGHKTPRDPIGIRAAWEDHP
jgi:hypothetical protein